VGIEAGHSDVRAQLGAVLRCDMVDSTGLMATNGVFAAIDARRSSTEIIAKSCHSGRLVETRGDGSLVWFDSLSAAIASGMSLQQRVAASADFAVRVAISLHEDTFPQVHGVSAEHSQRLESACPPGAVVVDAQARRLVDDVVGAAFQAIDPDIYRVRDFPLPVAPDPHTRVELRAVLFSDSYNQAGLELSERCVGDHDGVVLDTNGAGHLAVFESCRQAVAAARAMHAQAESFNLRADAAEPLSFRVAISVGEVTVSAEGEGFGVAVVEAARLLDEATATDTLMSSDVTVLGGVDATLMQRRGSMALKGLVHPVDIYCLLPVASAPKLADFPSGLRSEHRFAMVGRQVETAALQRRWHEATIGTASLTLVSGEEGIGKTRLVRELAQAVYEQGAIVLYGACNEGLNAPYAAVGAALAQVVDLDTSLQLASRSEGPLSAVLASTTSARPGGNDGAPYTSDDQTDLFEEVADLLGRIAVLRPVLMIIDDVQWAEPDTINLVRHIAQGTSDSRLALVATCRAEQLEGTRAASLLDPLGPTRRARHVQLDRLHPAEVVALLESQTGHALQGAEIELASKVAEITGGSPLYVEELLVHLAETDVVIGSDTQGWSLAVENGSFPIPASVLDLVTRRAGRLGASAVGVLANAAMIGATFDIEVLADVAELSVDAVLDIVDAAEEAQLLRAVEAGHLYRFADELSRRAFLTYVRSSRRARTHQRIAEALERIHPNHIDQLATHWTAAAGSEARAKAVHYLRRAGERDLAAAAWESASERQRAVLDILQANDARDIETLCEVHLALGSALRLAGHDDHRHELMTAADLARQARNGHRLFQCGAAMMRPGAWYPEAGVVDADIVAICEDSLMLLADDDPLCMHVMAALATNLAYDHDHERRTALVAEAQALAQSAGDLHMIGTMYAAELTSSHEPERFERRRKIAEEVRRIGRATGDKSLLITGSIFIVLDEIGEGRIHLVEPLLDELTTLVDSAGEYFTQYLVDYLGSALAVARCDPDMEERIERVRVRFENHPLDTFGMSLLQTGWIALTRGTLSSLLLEIVRASTTWDEGWGAKWNYALSRAHLDAGDEQAALAVVQAQPEPDRDFYWLASMCQLATLGLALSESEVCRRVVRELTPFRGRLAIIGLGIGISHQVSTALGQAHEGLGEFELAEALYRESVAQADEIGFPYLGVIARRYLAQRLIARDPNHAETAALLSQVIATSQHHGFADELRLAQELIAAG